MVYGLSAPAIDDLLQLGAIDFFVHPVSPDEVRSRIRRHLRRLVEEPQCQELDNEVKLPQSYYLPAMPKSRGNALTLHEAAKKYQLLLSDGATDRKSTRLNSSHVAISYAVFCLKKKKK